MQLTLNISHSFESFDTLSKFVSEFQDFCRRGGLAIDAPHAPLALPPAVAAPVQVEAPRTVVEAEPQAVSRAIEALQLAPAANAEAPEPQPAEASKRKRAPSVRGPGRPTKEEVAARETANAPHFAEVWGAPAAKPVATDPWSGFTGNEGAAIVSQFISVCGVQAFSDALKACGYSNPAQLGDGKEAWKFAQIAKAITNRQKAGLAWSVDNIKSLWASEIGSELWLSCIAA